MFKDKAMKKLIIGLGTGRCGTTSLTKFLCLQQSAFVTHEHKASRIGWYRSYVGVKTFIEETLRYPYNIVGDVAFFLLPYVEYIIKEFEDKAELYFICLKRNKVETINSFRRKQGWNTKNRHPWYEGPDFPHFNWDKCYPKFGFLSQEDAMSYYWDMYYEISERFQQRHPDKC
jgi:hypothetical protein